MYPLRARIQRDIAFCWGIFCVVTVEVEGKRRLWGHLKTQILVDRRDELPYTRIPPSWYGTRQNLWTPADMQQRLDKWHMNLDHTPEKTTPIEECSNSFYEGRGGSLCFSEKRSPNPRNGSIVPTLFILGKLL
jgi:hypothetical protein